MWSSYLQRRHREHGVFLALCYLCLLLLLLFTAETQSFLSVQSQQPKAQSYGVTVTDTLPAEPLLHCTCTLAVPCPPTMVPPVTVQVYVEPPMGAV